MKEVKEMLRISNVRVKMGEHVLFKFENIFLLCSLCILYDMINMYYQKGVNYIMFCVYKKICFRMKILKRL